MKMNYAEFTAEYQRRFKSVNFGFVHGCIKEALSIDKPMIAIYTEKDLLEVHDAAVIRKYEAEKHEKRPENINRILPGLAQKGLWFRASSYNFVDGWIEATPEATIEQYPLSEVLEDLIPAMTALGEDVVFTQDEDGNLELSPQEHERFRRFYARFGPLGLGFRNAWEIITWPLGHKAEVTVDPLRDEHIEILEHFGANLKPGKYLVKKPLSEVIPVRPDEPKAKAKAKASVLDFNALYCGYREQGFETAFAVVHFFPGGPQAGQKDRRPQLPGRSGRGLYAFPAEAFHGWWRAFGCMGTKRLDRCGLPPSVRGLHGERLQGLRGSEMWPLVRIVGKDEVLLQEVPATPRARETSAQVRGGHD